MKVVRKIFDVIAIITIIMFVYVIIMYNDECKKNNILKQKLDETNINNNNTLEEVKQNEQKLSDLKSQLQEKIEERDVWVWTKEKLEKAISN